ncbi:MAG: hypothetical protein EKK59_04485 [Neisseriaceae bacterium]|nr:MAG: hypothetical protein EKK59_04485 [Neisseriaceae bacterium]
MSKPRPTKDAWAEARQLWETDPQQTFESVASRMGVSRPAVSNKAKRDGWERKKTLRQIVERAQIQADKVTTKLSDLPGVTSKTDTEAAIDVRADVLERHRSDWRTHRELFTLQSISADFDAGKKAKISAEMLMIRQKGERAAYGLDAAADMVTSELSDDDLMSEIGKYLGRIGPVGG